MPVVNFPPRNPQSALSTMKGDHVAIRTPDLETSKRWFIEKLDFRVVHEWPYGDLHLAYVAPANDDSFTIEILGGAAPNPRAAYSDLGDSLGLAGYHHVCLSVASVDDTVTELRRRGVTIVTEPFNLAEIGRRLAFFADPWGNLFELAETL